MNKKKKEKVQNYILLFIRFIPLIIATVMSVILIINSIQDPCPRNIEIAMLFVVPTIICWLLYPIFFLN